MRLFLALFPPKELRDNFREDLRAIKKAFRNNFNYQTVDQIHLTIKYLGNTVSIESQEVLIETITRYQSLLKSADITINKLNFGFKSQAQPVVLKYEVYRTNELDELLNQANEIAKKTEAYDILRIKTQPDYHMTLARRKPTTARKIKLDVQDFLEEYNMSKSELTFRPGTIDLVESRKTKNGITYRIIRSFNLS